MNGAPTKTVDGIAVLITSRSASTPVDALDELLPGVGSGVDEVTLGYNGPAWTVRSRGFFARGAWRSTTQLSWTFQWLLLTHLMSGGSGPLFGARDYAEDPPPRQEDIAQKRQQNRFTSA